ncbi:polysaccharide deacetylase family protein [Pseudonocardia acidicola]|uniref:Polysaccharide deacetylase family protein n=1 Tax=Pseudonocardia acidicola TaxID=2724939 RepID=A0ABX1SD87_9PSEU|nr:polysaccharide deacetylase family protein [Pseudonocardia acidicola]NMH99536.1 polysaccharide deacetylase family protein [Pseudonocardia acidicola]
MGGGDETRLSRRGLLRAGLATIGAAAAAGCSAPAVPSAAPAAPAAATPRPSPTPTPARTGPATEIERAGSGRPEVALTFHGAGDLDLARKVLTEFHDRGAAVTVLAVGTWLQQYPDAAKMVTDLGHELGNHTWSHPDLAALGEAGIRAEIEKCRDRIAALTGGPGDFFRPSQAQHATAEVRKLAGAAGYPKVLSYDVDSRDFTDPGVTAIRHYIAAAGPGSVVSMHLGHPGTLAAVPGILDDLAARGLTPVTAGRLFA